MLRASCLKYNLSPYLQTPNRRSTYKDRLILLKEALFEEQDRCSTNRAFFLLVSIETNPSQCRSNEMRDFLLDSLDSKYLLYEDRSNVNWTVSKLCNCCTHICIRIRQGIWNVPRNVRDDWNREGKARVHVSLEFGYTLLFPGNKIITLLRTTIDLNHCVSKQNVTYTTLFLHVKTIFKLYLITFSNNINFLVSICKNTNEYQWKFLEPRCVIHRSRIFR